MEALGSAEPQMKSTALRTITMHQLWGCTPVSRLRINCDDLMNGVKIEWVSFKKQHAHIKIVIIIIIIIIVYCLLCHADSTQNTYTKHYMSTSHLSSLFCTVFRPYFDASANISNCTLYLHANVLNIKLSEYSNLFRNINRILTSNRTREKVQHPRAGNWQIQFSNYRKNYMQSTQYCISQVTMTFDPKTVSCDQDHVMNICVYFEAHRALHYWNMEQF